MKLQLVLASANPDKAAEVRAVLEDACSGLELLARPAEVAEIEETGETLEENARLKAAALLQATGIASVADDTGLEVDALGGAPGVYSARFAGEQASYADNVAKLLSSLTGVRPEARSARFRTVALALFPDGSEIVANGSVSGRIAEEARGDNGFGYDPLFLPDGGGGRTFAEMPSQEKHAISHRGRAFRALAVAIADRLES
ncbi:MAG TPA: RdgB/HAM1 family non-canonical purine NTP pyrophosphatase [Acidimicrobiales bacterium]|nr:RdgB/HAM1 family non-canonical purine NTP pyrophosphatase [Acidimicrobiales bacterium]